MNKGARPQHYAALSIMLLFDAPWPELVIAIGRWASSITMELAFVSLTPASCTGLGASFYSSYSLWLAVLLLLLFCLFLPALLDACRARRRDAQMQWSTALSTAKRLPDCLRDMLILVLLAHPSLTGRTLELFRCQQVLLPGRGLVSILMADYNVECRDGWWWGQLALHVVVLLGVSFGTIAAIVVLLYRRRHRLDHDDTVKYFGLLYLTYKPGRYYYEAVNMSFKVLLWMAAVMFDFGSELQLAAALVHTDTQ
jgi:hypothetical protein